MLSLTPFGRYLPRTNSREVPDFYDIVDDFFNDMPSLYSGRTGSFKLDVKENEKDFVIDAELPGFKKEEIALDFQNSRLVITANKTEEKNEEKENFLHRERSVCSMQRSVYLPNIRESAITAKFENGILTVNAPKSDGADSKPRIEIQ